MKKKEELCFCGSELLHNECHKNISKISFLADYIRMLHSIDEKLLTSLNPCGCHEGCDNCCYQIPIVSQVEFVYACYGLMQKNIPLTYVFNRGNEIYMNMLIKFPDLEKLIRNLENARDAKAVSSAYETLYTFMNAIRIPCPFLDTITKKCIVYEQRPIVCRTHGMAIDKKQYEGIDYTPCKNFISTPISKEDLLDIGEYTNNIFELSMFVTSNGITMMDMEFPIFYFCHLAHALKDNMVAKVQLMGNMTKEQYANEMHRRYTK